MLLESLGADASVQEAFEPYASQGLTLARVASAHRRHYQLIAEAGDCVAEPSAELWRRSGERPGMPVAGDWVAVRILDETQKSLIEQVLPRKTVFSRRAAGRREDEQTVAANIDLAFLVCGLDGDFNLRRLERYLTLTEESGAEAVIVLNKADLCDDVAARVAETAGVACGYPIVVASTRTPGGLDAMRAFLAYGRTVAIVGSSGVGKSTMVNGLLGEDRMKTGAARESDSKGRHTTTHRELIPIPAGGAIIDTPGMRELQLWAGTASVDRAFKDVVAMASTCKFRDCSHAREAGCAIVQALQNGTLNQDRWNSYGKLRAEARQHEGATEAQAEIEQKKRKRVVKKGPRGHEREDSEQNWG